MCDPDDDWYVVEMPTLEVDVADREPIPALLGPDGEPLPRLVHRFGFRVAPEWDTPRDPAATGRVERGPA